MLRVTVLFLALGLFALLRPSDSFAQQPPVLVQPAPVDPLAYQLALRSQIGQLAQQERELKRQGQPPGFHVQLITAAALGGAGSLLGAAALITSLVTSQCDCGPSLKVTRGLTIGGYAAVGVAGIWALTLTSIRRMRTDRAEVRRLHEQRRDLQQEYQRVRRGYATPTTLSLLLAPQQIGLRATY